MAADVQDETSSDNGRKLLEPGDMFGDYTVEKLLGQGGMGAVYLVRAPDGERYAIKLMFPDIAEKNADFRTRFAREAEFAMTLRHKNLISVYDAGEDPDTGFCYIIMDYVPGGSVKDRLRERGALPVAEAVSITAQIAVALELAHRHGVIHRDLKPDNIMFDADGTPKLADLGVAKFTDDAHQTTVTTTGMIIGTPAYMAPEQMMDSHHIDARADIYALGVVLYEMLTGTRPTEGSTAVELLAKALKGEPLPDVRTMRPEISAAIAHVLSLMCAPKPEDRPASSLAVAELLQKAATGRLVLPKKKPLAADAQRAKRPFPTAACIIGALVLGVAAFGWYAAVSRARGHAGRVPLPETNSVVHVGERAAGTTGVSPVEKRAAGTTDVSPVAGNNDKAAPRGQVASPANMSRERQKTVEIVKPVESAPSGEKLPKETSPRPKPLVLDMGGGVKMEMVGCPGGRFWMEPRGEPSPALSGHIVEITRPFWFGKFPVTVEQWERLMPPIRPLPGVARRDIDPKVPVQTFARGTMGLTSAAADEFARRLSDKFRASLPHGYVFRLPTEAEWGYALKANSMDPKDPFVSASASPQTIAASFMLFEDNMEYWQSKGMDTSAVSEQRFYFPHGPVGLRRPNAWGIHDMGGSTLELVLDSYVRTGEDYALSKSPTFNWHLLVMARNPEVYADNVKDPLLFERDKPNAQRWTSVRGGYVSQEKLQVPVFRPTRWRWGIRTHFNGGFALKLRLVVGPDLLKERGIAPSMPDANGRDARSPRVEPYKLLSKRPKPLTIKLDRGEQLELMGCPAGTFTMGYEGGPPIHAPHKVTISRPFWAGKYPVTRAQWDLFMPPRKLNELEVALGGPKGAVGSVTRKEVDEYCRQLTKRYRRLLPQGYIFRLPTLTETEYFWRAGSTDQNDPYSKPRNLSHAEKNSIALGDEDKKAILQEKGVKWEGRKFFTNSYNTPSAEVGLRKPNAWGLYDLVGNVTLWTLDTVASEKSKGLRWDEDRADDFDFTWAGTSVDPLIWCDEGVDGTGLRWGGLGGQRTWGEAIILYIKPGIKLLRLGFRLVVGPDLVKEKLSGKTGGAVSGGAKSIVVFPRADTQSAKWKKRAPWRYTTRVPTADWAEPDFRDGSWKRTNKPFGYVKDAAFMRIAERWTTNDVWLRRHFTWQKTENVTNVVFDMLHDENVEIYLNGTRILEENGWNADWEAFSVPVETFLAVVKEGDNVLAVKVHDNGAPRCFDCGLRVEVE